MAKIGTVEIVGPAGRVVVNESDLKEWQDKGYKLLDDKGDEAEEGIELSDMTVAQLKQFAKDNEIDLGDVTLKADILAVIESALEDEGDETEE